MKDNDEAHTDNQQLRKKNELPRWMISFAFAAMVVLFGLRFVAIPVSNQELAPFGVVLCVLCWLR